jgi:hypothetical protein
MTPREKAEELIQTFFQNTSEIEYDEGDSSGTVSISFDVAKECALIAVDEILAECFACKEIYWREVKFQIEKL